MNILELDEKLKQFNDIEKESIKPCNIKLKDHFSKKLQKDYWIINNEKLMKESEVISIHKHDRFIKFDKHKHDYLEMMFVYSGSIHQEIDGEKLEIKKSEIILLDMNVEHSIEEAQENDIAINILIKKEFFDWIFMRQIAYNDLISNFVVKALYGKSEFKQYIHFKTSENDKVWSFMLEILMEYYEQRNGVETAIRAYMLLLFNELLRDYQKHLSSQMVYKIGSIITVEILNYINENYKTVNLKTMSQHFNYNSDYIGKLIKKITGKSLTELIKEKKLKQAEYLLENTENAVVDIVTEVGYSNVTYFYKQFKEELGITPDEFRRKIKAEFNNSQHS
jgi:AraC family transcriptional regulator, dual regulator of chb operon